MNIKNGYTYLKHKMDARLKWLAGPLAAKKGEVARKKALDVFSSRFPDAVMSKFVAQVTFNSSHEASAEVFFKADDQGSLQSVFGSDREYWSDKLKTALGIGGFPLALTVNQAAKLPIPAVPFSESAEKVGGVLAKQKIWVTPTSFFNADFRDIFTHAKIEFTSGREANKWLAGPNICYWPAQLSFAMYCATTGCGVSRALLFEKGDAPDLRLSPQIRAFFQFHVYFTTRRILYEMGGIQSVSALPGDPTFSQTNNNYDIPSYRRLCAEFGIDPSSDFRFSEGMNHGLGNVYIYVSFEGPESTEYPYPGSSKFSDEGGAAKKGNLIYYISNDAAGVERQFDFFVPDASHGLTQAGLARLNQSIEAFVYSVLGAQVNVRSSILGFAGSAKEAQREFLVLMESAIRQPDITKSVQRYQLAIDEAKVRLDLAISPGTWLMPSKLVINTGSAVGYNNQLKRAGPGMKLGVNNGVNTTTKKVGVQHMAGGPSKTNRPTSHPSNPIHKTAVAAQSGKKTEHKAAVAAQAGKKTEQQSTQSTGKTATESGKNGPSTGAPPGTSHDSNKIVLIAAAALGGYAVLRFAL